MDFAQSGPNPNVTSLELKATELPIAHWSGAALSAVLKVLREVRDEAQAPVRPFATPNVGKPPAQWLGKTTMQALVS